MDYGVSVQVDWAPGERDFGAAFDAARKAAGPRLKRLFERLARAFPDIPCKYEGLGTAELRIADEGVLPRILTWMDGEKEKYQVVVVSYWTVDELARARWLPVLCKYAHADSDAGGTPLNRYPVVLCERCGWYDEAAVPAPYKVTEELLGKEAEIVGANNGLLVVKERVKAMLLDLVGDEVEWDEASVVGASGKPVRRGPAKDGFFWIRPKARIGRDLDEWPDPATCEKCGRLLGCGCRGDPTAKVVKNRTTVEHFGDPRANIACGGSWFGSRTVPEGWNINRAVFVCGGLWACLYNNGVKGLILPEQGVYSAKGESPVEPERRFADVKTGKEDKFLRLKMPWQKKRPP